MAVNSVSYIKKIGGEFIFVLSSELVIIFIPFVGFNRRGETEQRW